VCVCVYILLLITLKNRLFLISQILQATLKKKRFHTFLWNLPFYILAIVCHSNAHQKSLECIKRYPTTRWILKNVSKKTCVEVTNDLKSLYHSHKKNNKIDQLEVTVWLKKRILYTICFAQPNHWGSCRIPDVWCKRASSIIIQPIN
jgi:hypothetical protein